jgi:hypothetical protein
MFILLQYSFVFFVERIHGEVSPRALGVITRIQEVVGENYMLCYYVGSPEVCL